MGGGGVYFEKLKKMTCFQITEELSDLNEISYLDGPRNSYLVF